MNKGFDKLKPAFIHRNKHRPGLEWVIKLSLEQIGINVKPSKERHLKYMTTFVSSTSADF